MKLKIKNVVYIKCLFSVINDILINKKVLYINIEYIMRLNFYKYIYALNN